MPTRPIIENSKKIEKKFKKLEKTIIASFQAKRGLERRRKRENKKKSFRCVPIRPVIENSKKKKAKKFKKIQKIRKHHHSFFSSRNRLGKAEKDRE